MPRRPLIIDCDPGVDDAIALLLALASLTEFDLLGITTVAGNVPLALTQSNARKVCELAGHPEIPVYAGCPRPLLRSLITAEQVHGITGLDGADLPDPRIPLQSQHAVNFLLETLMQAEEPITLAVLGPLTNLAVALIQEPRITTHIAELVIMGGAIAYGNITPVAEFNFYVDPHAAQVVFSAGVMPTLISLDVTHQALTTPERLEAIRTLHSPVSQAAVGWLTHYGKEERDRYGFSGPPLHDPCVIAYLLQPDLFSVQAAHVSIEITSPLTLGQSVVDYRNLTGHPANAKVVQTIDAEGFYQLLVQRLARLSRNTHDAY